MRKFLVVLFTMMPFFALAAFPVKYDANFDITSSDKTFKLLDNEVTVSIERPIKPMKEITFTFTFKKPNIESISFVSNMEMYMGKYEFKGNKVNNNTYTLKQILTKCMSGKTKWFTLADITYNDGRQEKLYIFYDVK